MPHAERCWQVKLKLDAAKMVPAVLEETARKSVEECWEMLNDVLSSALPCAAPSILCRMLSERGLQAET